MGGKSMNRRKFVAQTSKVYAGISVLSLALSNLFCKQRNLPFKISLAEWSLHRTIFSGELDHLDFAETARKTYNIDAVEYVNQFFKNPTPDYLKEMKNRADSNSVKSLLIMCDDEGQLGDPDKSKREQAVENHVKWLEAAKYLGCHSIRVNAASTGSYDEQLKLTANGLHRLCERAEPYNLNVIVENHGGLSSNGKWLSAVIKSVNHPKCGTLPDFGNFRISESEKYDRYLGVTELMPFAKAVSAKSSDFDQNGNESGTDYFKMMNIVLDAGYHGYVGIEYGGERLTEHEGIIATKKLLEKVGKMLT
jgi:sugar phosphate isomerase/epimerase